MGSLTIIITILVLILILILILTLKYLTTNRKLSFFPFSFFLLPFPIFLYFFSFRRARPTKPCPVSCDCNCDDGHILLFFHLPSRCPGQRQKKKKLHGRKQKKSQIFVQFPVVIIHHIYTGGNVNRKRKKKYCGRDICGWSWSNWLLSCCFHCISCSAFLIDYCNEKQKERERDKEGAGILLPPSRECTGTSIQYLQEA